MISMRVVKHPRKTYRCAHCEKVIVGEHLYLFGGEQYGKPQGNRVCALCGLSNCISEVIDFAAGKLSKETKEAVRASIAQKWQGKTEVPEDFYCPCGCDGDAADCVYAGTCYSCGKKYYGGHGYGDKESQCDECRKKQSSEAHPDTSARTPDEQSAQIH